MPKNPGILEKYQTFIFDIWGVLHNGKELYPNATETFRLLRSLNKNIILLSNAPRPNWVAYEKLHALGLDIKIEEIITSGDFFLNELKTQSTKVFSNFEGKAFIFGEEVNKDLFKDISPHRANSIEEADYIVLLMYVDHTQELEMYDEQLKTAVDLNLPALCPNPDKVVVDNQHIRYPAGAFAERYEKMGGKVFYFGKPYKDIYEYVFEKYNLSIDKTLMIGDSLETDIKGAKNAGIDSLLLLTGVHSKESDVASLVKKYNTFPTYTAKDLGVFINDREAI